MTARQAKKVLRNIADLRSPYCADYSFETVRTANWISHRCWIRAQGAPRTPGRRWGRWDPRPSINPKEVPF